MIMRITVLIIILTFDIINDYDNANCGNNNYCYY